MLREGHLLSSFLCDGIGELPSQCFVSAGFGISPLGETGEGFSTESYLVR
jgi:hypothetical protein